MSNDTSWEKFALYAREDPSKAVDPWANTNPQDAYIFNEMAGLRPTISASSSSTNDRDINARVATPFYNATKIYTPKYSSYEDVLRSDTMFVKRRVQNALLGISDYTDADVRDAWQNVGVTGTWNNPGWSANGIPDANNFPLRLGGVLNGGGEMAAHLSARENAGGPVFWHNWFYRK